MAITVPAVAGKIINLGRAGENLATTVTFDVSDWIKPINEGGFGKTGTFTLFVQQGGGGYYLQVLEKSAAAELTDNLVKWHVGETNTAAVGLGKCELAYTINNVIVKSVIYDIVVTNSLDAEAAGEVPSPIESWINEVSQMTDQIIHAVDYANEAERWAKGTENGTPVSSGTGYHDNAKYYAEQAESAVQRVEGLDAGTTTTVAPGDNADVTRRTVNNHYVFDFEIPRGAVFWTTSSGYTSPNYTWNISNLTGPTSSNPAVGDIILYSYYRYTITSVNLTAGTVQASSQVSIRGATGATGTRGTLWYAGNTITGNSTTATTFPSSGISSALVNDQYLNTETGNTYKCTTGGAASVAKWVYTGNIRGPKGEKGDTGHGLEITGHVDSTSGLTVLSPQPAIGSVYTVGTSEPYNLWIKESTGSTLSTWRDLGKLGGTSIEMISWS